MDDGISSYLITEYLPRLNSNNEINKLVVYNCMIDYTALMYHGTMSYVHIHKEPYIMIMHLIAWTADDVATDSRVGYGI